MRVLNCSIYNFFFIKNNIYIMDKQKNVLVICSSQEGRDFNRVLNNNLKLLFGPSPNYTFCDGESFDETHKFPHCIDEDDKYDFIWFAGCNLINSIFRRGSELICLEKLKNSIKPNGYFMFTETKCYVTTYSTLENSLTLPLEIIDQHTKKVSALYSFSNRDLIFDYFKRHFIKVQLGEHVVYQLAKEGGNRLKKSRKYKKTNRKSIR
jgi:hypothetical protein